MPFQDDTRKYYLKKWAKSAAKSYGLKHLTNNKYYQRTVGDFNAIKHQLKNPWDKTGWYDLYNRASASRSFQRGLFDKLYPKPSANSKASIPSHLPSPPATKEGTRKRRAVDKLQGERNSKMAKYTKRSTRRSKRTFKKKAKYTKKRRSVRRQPKHMEAVGQITKAMVVYKAPKRKINVVMQTRENTRVVRRGSFWASAAPGRQSTLVILTEQHNAMSHSDLQLLYVTGTQQYNSITNTWSENDPSSTNLANMGNQAGKKLYIKKCKMTYDLTNQGPTSCYFKMYFILPKSTETAYIDPKDTWVQGYQNEEGRYSQRDQNYINAKPTDTKLFNQNFRVIKCIKGKMDPGDEKKIIFDYSPNRFLDVGYLRDHKTIKNMSPVFCMLVSHGVTADLINQPSSFLGSVTTTRTKIVGIVSHEYTGYTVSVRGKYQREVGDPYSSPLLDTTASAGTIGANPVLSIADAAGNVVDSNVAANFA